MLGALLAVGVVALRRQTLVEFPPEVAEPLQPAPPAPPPVKVARAMRTDRSVRFLGAAVVVALTILAAGCGSNKSADTTTTSSTVDWANGLCSALSTYQASLTSAAKSVTGNLSKSGLQDAVDQAKTATDTFVTTTKNLGKPDTDSRQAGQGDGRHPLLPAQRRHRHDQVGE